MKILDKTIKKTSTLFYLIFNQIFLYLQIFLFFFHEQLIKKKKMFSISFRIHTR